MLLWIAIAGLLVTMMGVFGLHLGARKGCERCQNASIALMIGGSAIVVIAIGLVVEAS